MQRWVCPICDYVLVVPAGKRARARLRSNKDNHLIRRTAEERAKVPRLHAAEEVVTPSANVPLEQRDWKCHICGLFLPVVSKQHTRETSIKAHFAEHHPGISPSEAYHQKQREDGALRSRMSQRGVAVGAHRRQEREAALTEIRSAQGHNLDYITFLRNPATERRGQDRVTELLCKHCWGIGVPQIFSKRCEGKERQKRFWPKLRKLVAERRGNFTLLDRHLVFTPAQKAELPECAPVRFRFCKKRPARVPASLMTITLRRVVPG